jgi:hypothetical protein
MSSLSERPGFNFERFLKSDVVIEFAQNRRLDIALTIANLDTIS